jgi:hypothetical protein
MKLVSKKAFYSYKIIPEKKLIVDYSIGTLSSNDMIEGHKILSDDNNYNEEYNRLIYINDTKFKVTYDDINSFVNYHRNTSLLANDKKIAVIANTESQLLLATIFIERLNNLPAHLHIFKNIADSAEFLGIEQDYVPQIEQTLKELKNQAKM